MLWRAATGCLLSAASSGWGRCSFWHGCFYAGRMCGHKIEICVSAPVKRAGTVQPSLFLPKFPLFFLASCRKQRVLKSSRLRNVWCVSGLSLRMCVQRKPPAAYARTQQNAQVLPYRGYWQSVRLTVCPEQECRECNSLPQ